MASVARREGLQHDASAVKKRTITECTSNWVVWDIASQTANDSQAGFF